jgi:hypothetical protein
MPQPKPPAAPAVATKPAVRRPPPVPVRVVKKQPVRKQAIVHRAPAAAAKPAPAAAKPVPAAAKPVPAAAKPAPAPGQPPLVRPGWRDPFGQ